MFSILRQAFDIVLCATNGIRTLFSSIFYVSHAIGFIIVKYVVLLCQSLYNAIITAFVLFYVLYEDFCIFFSDFVTRLSDIGFLAASSASFTADTINSGASAIKAAVLSVYQGILGGISLVAQSLGKGLDLIVDLAELLKWTIILIGRGFWLAIQLVPLCILYSALGIYTFVSSTIYDIYMYFETLSLVTAAKIRTVVEWLFSYVFDFPVEALVGLSVGTTLIYLILKYHRNIYRSSVRSIKRTIRITRTAFLCLCMVVIQHIQSWRRNLPAPANVDSDSDSTQDDEPAVPLRRSPRLQARGAAGAPSKVNNNPAILRRQLERELEEKLCIVCQDQHKCVIAMPCRHLCLCADCSHIIQRTTGTCPVCRQGLDRFLSVYM